MNFDWLDYLYYFKWVLILSQIFFIFLTALLFATQDLEKQLRGKRVLLLTAHPDDESMFFVPFLSYFAQEEVSLLCLTSGNAAGLGKVREKEVLAAGKLLKITRVEVLDKEELPDSMTVDWNPKEVLKALEAYLSSEKIDAIITFDDYGVSGHTNHRAINKALKQSRSNFPHLQMWELESTSLFRKYLGLLDIIFSSRSPYAAVNINPVLAWKAMATHHSQFVWYRKLFVVFSRYSYLNTFNPF